MSLQTQSAQMLLGRKQNLLVQGQQLVSKMPLLQVGSWYSQGVAYLEAVGLDGCQEGRQANLALQVQADLSSSYSQPLGSQLQPNNQQSFMQPCNQQLCRHLRSQHLFRQLYTQ